MMARIVEARPLEKYKIFLRFEDGVEGVVDIAKETGFKGVLGALRDPGLFKQVRVLPDFGTICWPNDVDLDPDVLYWRVTGVAPWKTSKRPRAVRRTVARRKRATRRAARQPGTIRGRPR
jgi:hypothetical protein